MTWTPAHLAMAEKWHDLIDEGRDAEAAPVWESLNAELGDEQRNALLQSVEDRREQEKEKRKRKPRVLRAPRRMSKAAESWRCLANYPGYEV